MKNVVKKIITVMLAFSLVFSVFALAACGPRELDAVEKSIVGEWIDTGKVFTYNDDGTYDFNGWHKEFKHDGDGTDPERGHYEIIKLGSSAGLALFDSDKDNLYGINSDDTVRTTPEQTRK